LLRQQFHYLSGICFLIFAVVDKMRDQPTDNFDFQREEDGSNV
jgi:hypothetical protein